MNHSITQPDLSRSPHQEFLLAETTAMAALWSRSSVLQEIWGVVQAVEVWPGMVIAPNRSGLCLTLNGVNLGHLRFNGRLDLPFGPEQGDQLVAEGIAEHDSDQSDRVVFDVRTVADVNYAVWLLRLAYLIAGPKVDVCSMRS
jgi:hypothetical protein